MDRAVAQLLTNSKDVAKTAMDTLTKIAENIIHRPKEEKFKRLKKSNAAVCRKLLDVPGGVACLVALGFTESTHEGEPAWCAPGDSRGFDLLIDGKARLAQELERLWETPVDTSRPAQGPGGIEGMLLQALQDPASLRRLLQNPMVAQMARANPDMVETALQSPGAQAALEQNPEMRQQLEALLGRPLGLRAALPVETSPEPFGVQLDQLQEMGFSDRAVCLTALQSASGDLEMALTMLVPS
ncbi:unnamed protein product [Polarella glacialis]|uniref:UBA domain-containing protein n=1 Tax=Polarella glacialis TaxID=89957 RepID=A0A813IEN4_POLGL|nr:unnamed protein product [Polarella glacialis]